MDPNANIREQRELAAAIVVDDFDDAAPGRRTPAMQDLLTRVDRLAELVLALDEWRTNGGFDPYDPNLTPQHRAIGRLLNGHHPVTMQLSMKTFDLPDGYVGFVLGYEDGRTLVGGIDPEGSVST